MRRIRPIFLDDGGVLNDNAVRGPQWEEFVAEYCVPRFGGSYDAWKEGNRIAVKQLEEQIEKIKESPEMTFRSFWENEMDRWVTTMFGWVGVPAPPPHERVELTQRIEEWTSLRTRSAFLGAIETVRRLHAEGYTLFTASGETSWSLRGYLTGMGILGCFQTLYGPDLINTLKASPLFYERMFTHACIKPVQALVVDDQREYALWANEAGATAVLISPMGEAFYEQSIHSIRKLSELPTLLQELK